MKIADKTSQLYEQFICAFAEASNAVLPSITLFQDSIDIEISRVSYSPAQESIDIEIKCNTSIKSYENKIYQLQEEIFKLEDEIKKLKWKHKKVFESKEHYRSLGA